MGMLQEEIQQQPSSSSTNVNVGVTVVSDRSLSSAGSSTVPTGLPTEEEYCTACRLCDDVCELEDCLSCEKKTAMRKCRDQVCDQMCREQCYTMCQIRRHCTAESAWIVAGGYVYDVTDYIASHPGGQNSILRKTGGAADCTQDLQFHSTKGKKLWKRYKIGKVKHCGVQGDDENKTWWMFWK